MERLLQDPIDVEYLDSLVEILSTGSGARKTEVSQLLSEFQENDESWTQVDKILDRSRLQDTKFLALNILNKIIKYRWKTIAEEQREGIKSYIVALILNVSSTEEGLRSESLLLSRLNLTLVQILKQEWPHNWKGFISEIVNSSKNESLCENNLIILRLLSEEVFEYSLGEMTTARTKSLKESYSSEFNMVYQLCDYTLNNSEKDSLIEVALKTMLRFLNWIPFGYIFETNLIQLLVDRFFPKPAFRNVVMLCFTEIVSLNPDNKDYLRIIRLLYVTVVYQISNALPDESSLAEIYNFGSPDDKRFLMNLTLFLVAFFKKHREGLENSGTLEDGTEASAALLQGHFLLLSASSLPDQEIFKVCIEYWIVLTEAVYSENPFPSTSVIRQALPYVNINMMDPPRSGLPGHSELGRVYADIFSRLRETAISRMAKPEEIIIVEDENGQIVRQYMKDTEQLALYKTMRTLLIYLTHLDYEDMEKIMLSKMEQLVRQSQDFSVKELNSLCWSVGSISNARSHDQEKKFLVCNIKHLLQMCNLARGKENRAVIASNIMYIVGSYPKFLRTHFRFLKTVVRKLFEFMHETFPGVREMSVDTFLKITKKCKRKFVAQYFKEPEPLIDDIMRNVQVIISALEEPHVEVFYEAIGHAISGELNETRKESLMEGFMEKTNERWNYHVQNARENVESLASASVLRELIYILKLNVKIASSVQYSYVSQLSKIYLDMLNVYGVYSKLISEKISSNTYNARTVEVKTMRAFKREALHLIRTFFGSCSSYNGFVAENVIPPLLDTILVDYMEVSPNARDPEVLAVMAVAFSRLGQTILSYIPRVLDSLFECTLEMIKYNFEDFPEHRVKLFELLTAVNHTCFDGLLQIPQENFKTIIDSIIWAIRHHDRQISEIGLELLKEILENISRGEDNFKQFFYSTFYLNIISDIFHVITDSFHKSGFTFQYQILIHLIRLVVSGHLGAVLVSENQFLDAQFLRSHLIGLFTVHFKNLSAGIVQNFVDSLFKNYNNVELFKQNLRDFLIQMKEFSGGDDNSEMFSEEVERKREEERMQQLRVPGLLSEAELEKAGIMDDDNNQEE